MSGARPSREPIRCACVQVRDTWRVTRDMADVPGWAIGGALIPAVVITTLFWFDHGVSSQLAQQPVRHINHTVSLLAGFSACTLGTVIVNGADICP